MSLQVEHLNKWFGQFQAIKDLSMEVQEGAIFGFLGANGAGKTTTMRMILDILRPDSGSITWNGEDVRQVPRRNWGYLPEERGLYPKMEVEDQLVFLARLNGLSHGLRNELLSRAKWRLLCFERRATFCPGTTSKKPEACWRYR
jgi:ABC-2 type transport system ATP-binding protein